MLKTLLISHHFWNCTTQWSIQIFHMALISMVVQILLNWKKYVKSKFDQLIEYSRIKFMHNFHFKKPAFYLLSGTNLPVTERNLSFLFAASLRAWKCYPAIISPNANKAQCCQIPTSLNGWFCQKPQKESPLRRSINQIKNQSYRWYSTYVARALSSLLSTCVVFWSHRRRESLIRHKCWNVNQ